MKQLFLSLLFVICANACLAQTVFVDPHNKVTINTDLSNFEYGATRTISFDNNDGTSVEENVPAGVGFVYIYNPQTKKGVIQFSRSTDWLYRRPYFLYDYSSSCYYGGPYSSDYRCHQ